MYHYTSVIMAKIQGMDSIKCWQECRENRNSHSLLVGMQSSIATSEDHLAISYNVKHILTIWSSHNMPR